MRKAIRGSLFAIGLCVLSAFAHAQGPVKTTVADTLYDHSGNLLNGRVVITNKTAFRSADGFVVAANTRLSYTVTGGMFSAQLVPNTGTTPSGTSYTVEYQVSSSYYSETWIVPSSGSPVNLAAVLVATPPFPSPLFGINQIDPTGAGCGPATPFPKFTTTWTCVAGGSGGGGLPAGGAAAAILQKNTSADGDASWNPNLVIGPLSQSTTLDWPGPNFVIQRGANETSGLTVVNEVLTQVVGHAFGAVGEVGNLTNTAMTDVPFTGLVGEAGNWSTTGNLGNFGLVGVQGYTHNFGNGTTASSVGWAVDFLSYNPGPNFGTLTNYAHFYAGPPVNARGTQAQNTFGFYADDQGSGANDYATRFLGGQHFWSQGTNGLTMY
jgi:hypothetical protein